MLFIFQVKYLSHDSSIQYCSKVVLDEFCELFPMLKFTFFFSEMPLSEAAILA